MDATPRAFPRDAWKCGALAGVQFQAEAGAQLRRRCPSNTDRTCETSVEIEASVSRVAARIRPIAPASAQAAAPTRVGARARRQPFDRARGERVEGIAAAARRRRASASLWTARKSGVRQLRDRRVDQRAELAAVRIEPSQRLAHRAVGARRRGRALGGRASLHGGRRARRRRSRFRRAPGARAVKPAAARADRRQHLARPMRDDQEQRARRRLLDHLQQRIGAGAVEVVGAVDDADAPAAERRRLLEHRNAPRARRRRGFR